MPIHGKKLETISDFFDALQLYTTILKSPGITELNKAKAFVRSYLFNVSFNSGIAIDFTNFPVKEKRVIIKIGRDLGQVFPYKVYETKIVKYYYQGISTEIPLAKYLAFYHVIEYFFEFISERDIFSEITSTITDPNFSPYKNESLKMFYKKIKKKIMAQKNEDIGNERNALFLCLREYIKDINDLVELIKKTDTGALEHYKNNDVVFADNGKKIDFSLTGDILYKNICNRIYAVRNAIVHSKEGEKLKYTPFKHDKELLMEIPLVKAIAELVIINSAKKMALPTS